jgi:hypothetical protein
MKRDPLLQQTINQLPVPKSDVLDVTTLRASADQAGPMWVGPERRCKWTSSNSII